MLTRHPSGELRRSPGVRAAILLAAVCAVEALATAGAWVWRDIAAPLSLPRLSLTGLDWLGVVLGALLAITAIALATRRRGAWALAMFAQSAALAQALARYMAGEPDYLTMTLGVLAVVMLRQDEVRQLFREAHG
jgi:hypothetical protein